MAKKQPAKKQADSDSDDSDDEPVKGTDRNTTADDKKNQPDRESKPAAKANKKKKGDKKSAAYAPPASQIAEPVKSAQKKNATQSSTKLAEVCVFKCVWSVLSSFTHMVSSTALVSQFC